jgi:hypothetical protein
VKLRLGTFTTRKILRSAQQEYTISIQPKFDLFSLFFISVEITNIEDMLVRLYMLRHASAVRTRECINRNLCPGLFIRRRYLGNLKNSPR